jgi:hypothetical protein
MRELLSCGRATVIKTEEPRRHIRIDSSEIFSAISVCQVPLFDRKANAMRSFIDSANR